MAYEFKSRRMVEFADTDMAGILHFSNYFKYMECVEHEFFRSLGLRVHSHSETRVSGWARVRAECAYSAPLRYEDEVELHLLVREKRSKSLRYEIVFRKRTPAADGGEPTLTEVARGSMTVVCVSRAPGDERLEPTTMPSDVDAAVDPVPG
jgi:acyl-CoA thioester hydrolase